MSFSISQAALFLLYHMCFTGLLHVFSKSQVCVYGINSFSFSLLNLPFLTNSYLTFNTYLLCPFRTSESESLIYPSGLWKCFDWSTFDIYLFAYVDKKQINDKNWISGCYALLVPWALIAPLETPIKGVFSVTHIYLNGSCRKEKVKSVWLNTQ